MTPRENLLNLYRRNGYSFAPVSFDLCPSLWEKKKAAIGDVSLPDYFEYPEGFGQRYIHGPKMIPRTEPDWRQYFISSLPDDTSFSEFGVAHTKGGEGSFHLWRMHHPMANFESLEQMQNYPWPEWDYENVDHITDAVNSAHIDGLPAIGGMACTVWETAWYIRDMTQLMMDMAMDDEKAVYILDKITDRSIKQAISFATADVDILSMGDDIGMQDKIMMSEDMYRQWLKPRLKKIITAAKQIKPDILIMYHSCGYVEPYIPDLIECGIDILNPVQPECMDFKKLHTEYSDVLAFNGTLGTQTTMPFGTPEDVNNTVIKNLDIAGSSGGLFVCPTHLLEPEVPWENIVAYVQACKEYKTAGG
jgi:uroporphyrinogen decarboxylase